MPGLSLLLLGAYQAALDFTAALRKRVKSAGFMETMLLQRICSSFASGLSTAKKLLEKRQLPVFAFTVAESGIRMKKADAGESPKIMFRQINPPGGMQATQVIAVRSTVQELADLYSKFLDRPVIDMTGLTDRFDFTLQYEADTDSPGPFAAVTAPTLFQAFVNQVGLKLRATRGPVNVLVIDSAARPSAN